MCLGRSERILLSELPLRGPYSQRTRREEQVRDERVNAQNASHWGLVDVPEIASCVPIVGTLYPSCLRIHQKQAMDACPLSPSVSSENHPFYFTAITVDGTQPKSASLSKNLQVLLVRPSLVSSFESTFIHMGTTSPAPETRRFCRRFT